MTHSSDNKRPNKSNPLWNTARKVLNVLDNRYFMPMLFSFGGAAAGVYFALTYGLPVVTAALIGFAVGFVAWLIIMIVAFFN